MTDAVRHLLYPLGFLASIAFGGRFLVQWLSSEIKKKSHVTHTFWRLSLAGNLLLALHALIQVQFHVCLVQACSAVISWRNLNLMQPAEKKLPLRTVLVLIAAAAASTILLFFLSGEADWFRIPAPHFFEEGHPEISPFWHFIGFAGILLFASRFWVQWWCSELRKKSTLGKPFWWISLSGGILSLAYFAAIKDPVNFIGPLAGMVPYVRNLMLIRKSEEAI